MDQKNLDELHELNTVKYSMKWFGWGSPVGLGIFLLILTVIAALVRIVFFE